MRRGSVTKTRVLFVCIHNAGRSQMAEALLRHLGGDRFEADSAGLEAGTLNPIVVDALKELGLDISRNEPKSVFDLQKGGRLYDVVVTVCDEASAESCPVFPGPVRRLHWSFKDPARFEGTYEERLASTRAVRDEIQAAIERFVKERPLSEKR